MTGTLNIDKVEEKDNSHELSAGMLYTLRP